MAGKSFGTQIFQGFIRSAVNQVGRDGGKVISNRVYGDSHSTPIRGVRKEIPIEYESAETIQQINIEPKFFTKSAWLYPVMFLGEFVISPIAVLFHISSAVQYFMTSKGIIEVQKKVETWVPDRRRIEGQRFDGYSNRTFYLEGPITKESKRFYIIKGFIHLLFAGFFGWIFYEVYTFIKAQ